MRAIPLSNGIIIMVDNEDYERLRKSNWHHHKQGYSQRSKWNTEKKKPETVYLHREIMDVPKSMQIDHINRNVYDNRKKNLRVVKTIDNLVNRKFKKEPQSKYRGVYKKRNRFVANCFSEGKRFYCGSYGTEEEAAIAYNQKMFELFGEDAYQNEIK